MLPRGPRRNPLSPSARAARAFVFRAMAAMRLSVRGSTVLLRQQVELLARGLPGPRNVGVHTVDLAGLRTEVLTPGLREPQGALFYIHGGGYTVGSARTHRAMVARLAIHARMRAYLPEYRLAPEHPFPAAPDDVLRAYLALREREPRIVVAGESAGGGLAAVLCQDLLAAGLPLPEKLYLQSPWTDLSLSSRSHQSNDRIDPMLKTGWLESQFARHYVGSADRRHPRMSPLFGQAEGLPPTFIHVGTHETLYDDAVVFARELEAAGVNVRLVIGHGLWHVWPIMAPLFPEATAALREAGHWLGSS